MDARTERKAVRFKALVFFFVCALATAFVYALKCSLHSVTGTAAPSRARTLERVRSTLRVSASGRTAADAQLDQQGPPAAAGAPRLRAFVGVMSSTRERRDAVRATWFPNAADLDRLQADTGIRARFVLGHWPGDAALERAADEEEAQTGDILRLPVAETYQNLPIKTWTFFRTVFDEHDPDYIVKTDDDLYTRVARLPAALREWEADGGDYVGCPFIGGEMFDRPRHRFFEPLGFVFAKREYYLFFSGGFYALSRNAARMLRRVDFGDMRIGAGEDTTMGMWMLAFNVSHTQDPRVCHYDCQPDSIAVTGPCNGLCNPGDKLLELHARAACRAPRGAAAPPLAALETLPVRIARLRLRAVSCKRLRGRQVDTSACDALDRAALGAAAAA